MERVGDTLIDAVIAVARADKEVWPHFRRDASRVALRETEFTDYAAESFLRDWFCPSWNMCAIDGWARQFILDFLSEALAGRCRLRGFVGLKEVEIPAGIFLSERLVSELCADGESFRKNEIKLPNGDLVIGVTVEQPGNAVAAAAVVSKRLTPEIPPSGNQPSPQTPAADHPAKEATVKKINEAITAAYDKANVDGEKPPNVKEIVAPVQAILRAEGYEASGRQIQKLAAADQHKIHRRKIGPTVANEKRQLQRLEE